MILSECTHDTVLHVARNMRDRDREEIYNVRWDDNPFTIVNDVMARREFSWVAWRDQMPCAVIGGMLVHPGVWSMYCFATDDFPRVAIGLTRFAGKTLVPTLFDKVGAHRLQCDSHEKHVDAHRWLSTFGAELESVKRAYGRDGADYFTFAIVRPLTAKVDVVG
jgi:hypothetical protein